MAMYNVRMLINDAAKFGAPKADSERIWKAFGEYVDEVLRMGKGLKVPKFGSFTSVKNSVRDAVPGIKGRVFFLTTSFCRSYGVQSTKVGKALLSPCLEFNMSKLAYKSGLEKDAAQITIQLLFRTLGQAIASGQNCRILIEKVGILTVQKREVNFRFQGYPDLMPVPEPPKWGVRPSNTNMHPLVADLLGESSQTLPKSLSRDPLLEAANSGRTVEEPQFDPVLSNPTPHEIPALEPADRPVASSTVNLDLPVSAPGSRTSTQRSDHSRKLTKANSSASIRNGATARRQRTIDRGSDMISSFPRFSSTTSPTSSTLRNNTVVESNLRQAFTRLETQLAHEEDKLKKQDEDIEARQALTQQLFVERRRREKAKQDELNSYLRQQAEANRAARAKLKQDILFSVHPDPGRAFPMEKQLDVELEKQMKASLKKALDEQVTTKSQQTKMRQQQEQERERFLIKCMEKEAKDELHARMQKRNEDRMALSSDWEKQRVLSKQSIKLCEKII